MLANQLLCDRFLFKDSLWSLSDIPCFTLSIVSWQYSHVQFAILLKRNKRWQKPGRVFVSVREIFFYYEVETSWIKEKRKCLTATLIIYIDFTLYVSFLLFFRSLFVCAQGRQNSDIFFLNFSFEFIYVFTCHVYLQNGYEIGDIFEEKSNFS